MTTRPGLTANAVNHLNIGLMIVSAAAAISLPFEVFLLSYAVLGPLHYLTEISWLHTRDYFTQNSSDRWLLVGVCVAVVVVRFIPLGVDRGNWVVGLTCCVFSLSAAMAFKQGLRSKLVGVVAGLSLMAVIQAADLEFLIVLFLPTLIHVFVFTAAFVLYGALRGRSVSGFASLLVFCACAAATLMWEQFPQREIPEYVRNSYAPFANVNLVIGRWFGLDGLRWREGVYRSEIGISVMRFIAFAYTYHYLNWFSKTSVIQWHRVPPAWTIANGVLWVASLVIYSIDYRLGLSVLFFLSLLHVFLEFPLNHQTFVGIGREVLAIRPLRS